ncbi:hypothetical protein K491DRAFT_675588 [Lophiostoma macrostomum CBS 122681]|uniref:Uncharacterized protein n=1 Tax=Lophiostoma macrostomum CBS 122681 TaxID=1314788 RepID=A0A6A6TJG1_9PLEO|nr:hypothetical protein K491DRAFT_675588 [Lophiostoma macrostomum CBS 122681]
MAHLDTKYALLQRTSEDSTLEEGAIDISSHTTKQHRSLKEKSALFTVVFILVLSLCLNALFLHNYQAIQAKAYSCISEYTGIGLTKSVPYYQHTDYISPNLTLSNTLWEAIDTSPNTIALSPTYIRTHSLNSSIPFPWDPSKGLYLIKAFHHLHCLKNMRRAYLDALGAHPGAPQMIAREHVLHCLDILRQDVMCRPDDTPMPSRGERHAIGDGQVRRCKDWGELVRWTEQPERHACFRMISEYRRIPNTLEEFQYCRDDSPYKKIAEEYFAKHGHRDPYGGLDGEDGEAEERWGGAGGVEGKETSSVGGY